MNPVSVKVDVRPVLADLFERLDILLSHLLLFYSIDLFYGAPFICFSFFKWVMSLDSIATGHQF